MIDPFPIEEHSQETITLLDKNGFESSTKKLVLQRSLSGEKSVGEESLLTENPVWLISPKATTPVFNSCLCSLDEVVATPSFNVSVIGGACDQDFKFFKDINESEYAKSIHMGFAAFGVFAILSGFYVQYCKLREIERTSDFFYFSRLFKTFNEKEIEERMGQIEQDNNLVADQITYAHLRAAAYFYPPDISSIARWRRRFFCSKKEKKRLKALNNFLGKSISKKEKLDALHKKIVEKATCFLNFDNPKFEAKRHENNWTISLENDYGEEFFNQVKHLITETVQTIMKENNNKKGKKFIKPILDSLGQASFIYWILLFIFYFIPMAPVVTAASISVIPWGFVFFIVLPSQLFLNIKKTKCIYNSEKEATLDDLEKQHKEMIEKKIATLNKQEAFLKCLLENQANLSIELGSSPVLKDLHAVLKNRNFSKYHAIGMGFVDGCFFPLFVGWLFQDGIKIILTYALCKPAEYMSYTPIGPWGTLIITAAVLVAGIVNGVYSARKANHAHKTRFDDLESKINVLKSVAKKKILNKSLGDYDRILRRFSDEQPTWTSIKKFLSRLVVIIKRLGTGSLIFRLIIWGMVTAITGAVFTVPACFSVILIVGTVITALATAVWHWYAYNLESKATQAGRVVEYLVQSEQLAWIDAKTGKISQKNTASAIEEANSTDMNVFKVKNQTEAGQKNNHNTNVESGLFKKANTSGNDRCNDRYKANTNENDRSNDRYYEHRSCLYINI